MKRSEMRAQIRILLGETQQDGYADSEINTQINVSCLLIARDILSLQTFRDVTTTAYNDPNLTDPEDPRVTGRYALPDDFLSMIDSQLLYGGVWYTLEPLTYDDFQARANRVQGGRPMYYRLEFGAVSLDTPKAGDQWLWPYPDGAYPLRRVYFQKPTAMDDDEQTSELPEAAHQAACYHAAMILSRKFKDRVLIQEMIALWNDEEARVKKWVNTQDNTRALHVKNVYGRC